MSQIIFNELSDIIENRLHALKNYQFVMYAHVLINGKSSKYDIQKSLARANNSIAENYKNCPVFRVLTDKKMVIRTKENDIFYYQLAKKDLLSTNEINDLIKIVQKARKRYENK